MNNRLDLLIVEDSANDAHMISRILRRESAEIDFGILSDGQQALDYLLDEGNLPPKAVLLDMKLPLVNGFEVLEQVRQRERLNATPIVMFSSSTLNHDLQTAYFLGANSYLIKPQTYQDLQTMIRQFSEYWLSLNKQPKHD